jgi:CHAT domain-containing protein
VTITHTFTFHRIAAGLVTLLGLALAGTRGLGDATQAKESISQAQAMSSRGQYEDSLPLWRTAVQQASDEKDSSSELNAAVGLADALQNLGQARLAIDALEIADKLARQGQDKLIQARIESSLGTLYMFDTNPVDAEGNLTKSLALAREIKDAHLTATALNNLANLRTYQKKFDEATGEYQEGADLASSSGNKVLAAKILANLVKCAMAAGSFDEAEKSAFEVIAEGPGLPDSHEKSMALLGAGKACVEMATQGEGDETALRKKAYGAYREAEKTATRIGDNRALSYALGYQGELYKLDGKPDDALVLTRHAALLAQELKSPDILFRWQWQIARILSLQHRLDPAISAYQSAVATLQSIRHDMSLHYGNTNYHSSFREAAGAIYFELADLLFQRADNAGNDADIQTDLKDARDTAEDLKAAELEDYFQDDCANLLKAKVKNIQTISSTAVVVYIIPLPDRTEILLNMPSGRIERVKSPVTGPELEETATVFRVNLEKRTTDEYLEQAAQLYDWLIRPLGSFIDNDKIDTLVFVPDGALRTIPMAALYDGAHFLVEKYAIATTPGLTLMEPKPLATQKTNLIINGLSEGVQGFPALSYVPEEVKKLKSLYGGPQLMNSEFVQKNIEKEFSTDTTYSIVHIASHGHFDSDSKKTFILTYDSKLTLDELEQMIRPSQMKDRPVELLTLSACETAAGDDRAALGLAGIAVKAGARSALATLWFVNDEASAELIDDFYTNLHDIPGISKAKALQKAQIKLLSDPLYGHPCYWAPYQIIGNWL